MFKDRIKKDFPLKDDNLELSLNKETWESYSDRYYWKGREELINGNKYKYGTFLDKKSGMIKEYKGWKRDDVPVEDFEKLMDTFSENKLQKIDVHAQFLKGLLPLITTSPLCLKYKFLPKKGVMYDKPNQVTYIPMYSLDFPKYISGVMGIKKDGSRFITPTSNSFGFFPIGKPTNTVFLVEDFESACLINELTGLQVIICFNERSLIEVTKSFAKENPSLSIVSCINNKTMKELTINKLESNQQNLYRRSYELASHLNVHVIQPTPSVSDPDKPILTYADYYQNFYNQFKNDILSLNTSTTLIPLGVRGKTAYIYTSKLNRIIPLSAADGSVILSFLAPDDFWMTKFPHLKRADALRNIISVCSEKNFEEKNVRRCGVWDIDGEIVINDGRSHIPISKSGVHFLPIGKFPEIKDYKVNQEYLDALKYDLFPEVATENIYDVYSLFIFTILGCMPHILPFRFNLDFIGSSSTGKTWMLDNWVRPVVSQFNVFTEISTDDTVASIKSLLQKGKLFFVFDENEAGNKKDRRWFYDLCRQSNTKEQYTKKMVGKDEIAMIPVAAMAFSIANARGESIVADQNRTIDVLIGEQYRVNKNFASVEGVSSIEESKKLGAALAMNVVNNLTDFKARYYNYYKAFKAEHDINPHKLRVISSLLAAGKISGFLSNDELLEYEKYLIEHRCEIDLKKEGDQILDVILGISYWRKESRRGQTSIRDVLNKVSSIFKNGYEYEENEMDSLISDYSKMGSDLGVRLLKSNGKYFLAVQTNSDHIKMEMKKRGHKRFEAGYGAILLNEMGNKKRVVFPRAGSGISLSTCCAIPVQTIYGDDKKILDKIEQFFSLLKLRSGKDEAS